MSRVTLEVDLRRKVAATLAIMDDPARPSGTVAECEMRMGMCTDDGFDARIEPCLFYGAFEMVAFGDVYNKALVGPVCVRRVEYLPHSDPRCRYRVRHVPADVRRCRSEIKRVVDGTPVRQFCSASLDAHDVRVSMAREMRIREHECTGKACAVPDDCVWHERRSLTFAADPFWRADFTRVCEPRGEWRYHIEIELRVRALRAHLRERNEEPDIGALVASGLAVMNRVQSGLKNARVRHARLATAAKIRGEYWPE